MKRVLPTTIPTPLVVLGLVALVALVYVLVLHEQKVRSREVVRAELDACRTAYIGGGLKGLRTYLSEETPVEREAIFVEVLGADNQTRMIELPQDKQEKTVLSPLAANTLSTRREWIRIPSAAHHSVWTIGRASLPDGSVLYVGHLAATQNQESE